MGKEESEFKDVFTEIEATEHVLSLDYYLHRAIIKWQDALDIGIKLGKIDDGLTARALAANMAIINAEAKGLIEWNGDNEHKKELEDFKKSVDKEKDDKLKNALIADFKMGIILKIINKHGIKDGKVII